MSNRYSQRKPFSAVRRTKIFFVVVDPTHSAYDEGGILRQVPLFISPMGTTTRAHKHAKRLYSKAKAKAFKDKLDLNPHMKFGIAKAVETAHGVDFTMEGR